MDVTKTFYFLSCLQQQITRPSQEEKEIDKADEEKAEKNERKEEERREEEEKETKEEFR